MDSRPATSGDTGSYLSCSVLITSLSDYVAIRVSQFSGADARLINHMHVSNCCTVKFLG